MNRVTVFSLLAILGLLAFSAPTSAQALVASDGSLLTLDTCRIRATIEEGVALVDIDQVFRNRAHNAREGTYRIKLPRDAVVSSFSMWINGREKQGRVLEARTARRVYDRLVRLDKNPALLEQEGWRTFRVRVYPIPARDTVRIRLRYAYVLPDDLGLQTLEVPMLEEVGTIGECVIQVTATGRRDLALLECVSHPSATTTLDGNRGEIVWAAENWRPMAPFIVRLLPRHQGLDLTVLTHREPDAEEGFFLIRVLPRLESPAPLPRDVVFVMDRSGSMKGQKIEQAREALRHGLSTLRAGDRFNIISFSTTTRLLKTRTMLPVNDETLAEAREEVAKIEAGGSTNIDQALSRALALRDPESERLFLLVFLTDGIPTVGEKQPIRIIESYREASGGKVRLFAFGVGDGVKDFLLTHLARGSRGTAVYVREDEDLEIKLSTLFTKVGHPLLADPEIRIAGTETVDVIPDPLPDLYRGEALVLAGRYREGGKVELQLSGRLGTGRIILDFPGEFPTGPVSRPHVAQLWAKLKIDQLLDDLRMHGLIDEIRQSIIDLGVRYQVVTPYTSYVVVEDDVHIPDPAEMAKVPEASDKPDAGPPAPTPNAPVAKGPANDAGGSTDGGGGESGGGDGSGDEPPPDERYAEDPPPEEDPPPPPPPSEEDPPEQDPGNGGSYRGPAEGPAPGPRNPDDPQPPAESESSSEGEAAGSARSASPPADTGGAGGGSVASGPSAPGAANTPGNRKNTRRDELLPDSWEYWWAYNRDHVLRLGSGLEPHRRPGPNEPPADVVIDRILPALEAVIRRDDRVASMQAEVALALAKLGASRPDVASRVSVLLLGLAHDGRPLVEDAAVTSLGVLGHGSDQVVATLCDLASRKTCRTVGDAPAAPAREDLRGRAAIALGMLNVPSDHPAHGRILFTLRTLLEDKASSTNLRACALIGLGFSGDPALVPKLEIWTKWHRGTRDGDLVGSQALAATVRIESRRPDRFARVFAHLVKGVIMGGELARTAVLMLGEIGSRPESRGRIPASVVRILERTIHRGDPQTAGLSLLALGKIGGTAEVGKLRARAFDLLRTELRKGDGITRPYAALAIGLMGQSFETSERARGDMCEVVRNNLEKKAHRVAPRDLGAYALALGMLGDEKVRPTLRALAEDRAQVRRLRGSAFLALGLIGDERDRSTLESRLEDRGQEDRFLRFDTCVAAGLHGDDSFVPILTEILRDPGTSIYNQNSAALALVHIGKPETVESLIKLVRAEKAPTTNRATAVAALGLLVDSSEVPVLRRLAVESNHRSLAPTLEAILRSQ